MITFHPDLDNTLIFSYKHDIGSAKRCVEIYQGREVSFMTEETHRLLTELNGRALLAPVTTRTEEQYRRIDLGLGTLPYALVCNGGVLLADGKEDESWYRESMEMIAGCRRELEKARRLMESDADRSLDVRNIRGLFLFTKSREPEASARRLRGKLDMGKMDVFTNGVKIYALPKQLNKGEALRRFRKKIRPEMVIAAGDSEFDIPMLEAADIGLAPEELGRRHNLSQHIYIIRREGIFSEQMLRNLMVLTE